MSHIAAHEVTQSRPIEISLTRTADRPPPLDQALDVPVKQNRRHHINRRRAPAPRREGVVSSYGVAVAIRETLGAGIDSPKVPNVNAVRPCAVRAITWVPRGTAGMYAW